MRYLKTIPVLDCLSLATGPVAATEPANCKDTGAYAYLDGGREARAEPLHGAQPVKSGKNLAEIRVSYAGPVVSAHDLECIGFEPWCDRHQLTTESRNWQG